ncbi:MAG: hypothetical protein ABIH38_00265 [Patescibacteria group bacterium]
MAFTNYNLNDLYLKTAAWFAGHKDFFKKWWVIAIVSADLLMIVYVAISFLLFAFEIPRYNSVVSQMGDNFINNNYRQESQPLPLQIEYAKAISVGSNRYDIVAKVKNINKKWGIKNFKYLFKVDDKETPSNAGYIWPDQEKYFVLLNNSFQTTQAPGKLEFVGQEIEWQKLGDQSFPQKISFTVSEAKMSQGEVAGSLGVSSLVTAKVKNSSVYSFWKVGMVVVVSLDDDPLAVNYYTLREFKSFAESEITVSWLKNISLSATVEIFPEVNIFDGGNFMS